MPKIQNRQIINLSADLNDATKISQIISLSNMRFVPDEVIVRQISYSCTAANQQAENLQIYFDIAQDLIIGSFPIGNVSATPNTTFRIRPNFNGGAIKLEFQLLPASGTGTGQPVTGLANLGKVSIILEFIKYV